MMESEGELIVTVGAVLSTVKVALGPAAGAGTGPDRAGLCGGGAGPAEIPGRASGRGRGPRLGLSGGPSRHGRGPAHPAVPLRDGRLHPRGSGRHAPARRGPRRLRAPRGGGGGRATPGPSGAPRVDLPSQSIARRAGLGEIGAVLRSTTGDSEGDDDLVVQDEAPAARIDVGDGVAPALQPLGTLTSSRDALPAHRILSRRSPRGPPAF